MILNFIVSIFDGRKKLAMLAIFLLVSPAIQAGLPQPMCVFYGQALDGFGWPYTGGAEVILRVGTNEYAHHTIEGALSPGVNFSLYVHLDDGSGEEAYVRYAMSPGDVFEIIVRDGDGEKTIMEGNTLPSVGNPGDVILVNVTAGDDADGDGLPDEWEQYLVDVSTNSAITSIEDVHAGDDYDGDGVSNGDEYTAGTFAFLNYDYFFTEKMEWLSYPWFRLEFLSVPGKVYRVFSTTNIADGVWFEREHATECYGPLQVAPEQGDGAEVSFYIKLQDSVDFFRTTVE